MPYTLDNGFADLEDSYPTIPLRAYYLRSDSRLTEVTIQHDSETDPYWAYFVAGGLVTLSTQSSLAAAREDVDDFIDQFLRQKGRGLLYAENLPPEQNIPLKVINLDLTSRLSEVTIIEDEETNPYRVYAVSGGLIEISRRATLTEARADLDDFVAKFLKER
jgi:hypothetical protein